MPEFKISGFADEGGKTAEEQIQVLKDNDIFYIEVRNVDGKNIIDFNDNELIELKDKFDKENIKVSAIGSPIGKSPIEEDFNITKIKFERTLVAAEILDTVYIRAFSFFIPKESDPMLWADEVVFRMSELVRMAKQKGKLYALENESGIFTDTPERCIYVLEKIPDLCYVFDAGNFIKENVDSMYAWNLLKKKVSYIHIKDATRNPKQAVPAGEGEGHIAEILKSIYADGFNDFISVEPHLGYMKDISNAQRFKVANNALKKILNNEFNCNYTIL